MAYVDQAKKAIIAAELKKVIPAGWKHSLSVSNHSTIVLTISAAPVDLLAEVRRVGSREAARIGRDYHADFQNVQLNTYWLEHALDESLAVFTAIKAALNTGNHNRSDPYTDYYDVGHYVEINIGRWNKQFIYLAPLQAAA